MNAETAREVAWAMSMIPVYEASLEEAEEASSDLDNALDAAIDINVEQTKKIHSLENWRTGLLVSNFIQALLNGGGIFLW